MRGAGFFMVPALELRRERVVKLDEVEITATRVKMYYRGDTLVVGNALYVTWISFFMRYRRELDIKRFNLSAREQSKNHFDSLANFKHSKHFVLFLRNSSVCG